MAQPTRRQIAEVIVELSKSYSQSSLAEAIAAYLATERRTSELDAIMREVKTLRSRMGVNEVTITTAFPAPAAIKDKIVALLGNGPTVINEVIDKNVIGGVRVEANDLYLDLTVRNRLNKLKVGVKS